MSRTALSDPQQFDHDGRMLQVVARVTADLTRFPAPVRHIGEVLVTKLTPPRWTLEWYLPRWLGGAFDLSTDQTDELVLANVYGLCYVALQDTLMDDELPPWYRHDARLLSSAFHHRWLERNALLMGGDPHFWVAFNRIMQEWWDASFHSNERPRGQFDEMLHDSWQRLAHRASPLKLCCVVATRLAGKETFQPMLEESLDHHHVAAVLLDHAQDWRADLGAGRYNVYLHCLSSLPQTPDHREALEAAVMDDLWFGRRTASYFDAAHARLVSAEESVAALALNSYVEFLAEYHRRLDRYHHSMIRTARRSLERVTMEMFGDS